MPSILNEAFRVARPRRASAGGGGAVDRSRRTESSLAACRPFRPALTGCRRTKRGPEEGVGNLAQTGQLVISPAHYSPQQKLRLGRRNSPRRVGSTFRRNARRVILGRYEDLQVSQGHFPDDPK